MRRSNSPTYDRRRSPPRRDRRDFPLRRRRSFSRERYEGNRTRRSSPGFKRFRRDDDHFDRYERGSPHRRSGYDRDRDSHDRYHDRRDGPESYREFIMNLPNDVTPDEAHRRYQNYLVDWYGSVAKSEFEQFKDEEWMKAKHDPRAILKIIEKHKTHAQSAAKEFAEAMKPGGELDIESQTFDQGVLKTTETEANKGGEEDEDEDAKGKSFVAPHVCWSKDRIESDLKLSTELVQKLDAEKEITENPILTNAPPEDKPEVKLESEGGTCDKDATEETPKDSDETNVKRLDLLLTYLWRVHMIDYYSGHELNDKEYENAKCRMLRPPRDHTADEQTDKRMLEELKVRVDNFWSERIKKGNPLQQKTQTARVEKVIEEFVEAQVIEVDSKKWGNKLSSKMFVGKEFVIKHIRLKHSAVVDAEREKILDEIYFDNFRKEKEDQERKMVEERERALRFGPQAMEGSYNGAYPDGFGHGAPGVMAGGQGMMGPPIVPAPMMGAAMGQMLMPAPGAGPMGPFVLQPVPTGGGMAPMDMGPMGGAGRGRGVEAPAALPAGRVGSGQTWSGQREYYDLDAPQNNRAVLDYGDL